MKKILKEYGIVIVFYLIIFVGIAFVNFSANTNNSMSDVYLSSLYE